MEYLILDSGGCFSNLPLQISEMFLWWVGWPWPAWRPKEIVSWVKVWREKEKINLSREEIYGDSPGLPWFTMTVQLIAGTCVEAYNGCSQVVDRNAGWLLT